VGWIALALGWYYSDSQPICLDLFGVNRSIDGDQSGHLPESLAESPWLVHASINDGVGQLRCRSNDIFLLLGFRLSFEAASPLVVAFKLCSVYPRGLRYFFERRR
jgi:hypothetical protein